MRQAWRLGGQQSMWGGYLPFLVLALVNLFFLVAATRSLASQPYLGISCDCRAGGYLITNVVPEGPAARAGVQPGDQVIALDGQLVGLQHSPWSQKVAGEPLAWTLRRSGETHTLTLVGGARPVAFLLPELSPVLVALVFWGASLLVWVLHPFHQITRLFFLASQMLVGGLTLAELRHSWPSAGIWSEGFLLVLAPLALHIYANFPDPLPTHWQRPLLRIAYGSTALVALLTLVRALWDPSLSHQELWFLAFVVEDLILLVALILLLRRRPWAPLQVRRCHRLLVFGMVAGLSPIVLLSLLPYILTGRSLVDEHLTTFFLILLPVTYAYALLKGELGQVDFFLNRGLVYMLLSALMLLLSVGLSLGASTLWGADLWRHPLAGSLFALGAVATFGPVRASLQGWVDHLFYGGWYDYRSVVRASSQEVSQTLDRVHLTTRLLGIAQTMRFQHAALFWLREQGLVWEQGVGAGGEQLGHLVLSTEGAMVAQLTTLARPCWRAEVGALSAGVALSPSEQAVLAHPQVLLWLPLVSRGVLRGLLLLGTRQGEEQPDGVDLDILATVAGQAAVAAENVALLETLRARLAEGEQMRADLAEAQRRLAESREAERLHLAQELHDGPVQDLYGARFQLGVLTEALTTNEGRQRLDEVQALLEEVTGALRSICSELRPPALAPFGLAMAVRSYAERFAEEHPDLDVRLVLDPDGQLVPERTRLALFRICQQALNNIARHAAARAVEVRLSLDEGQVQLEVSDDGRGFAVPERWITLARQGHFGLLGAAERAEAVGGRFEVISAPGEGTLICVTAPVPEGASGWSGLTPGRSHENHSRCLD